MNPEEILDVKNLSVVFEKEPILKDISFTVKRGDALAIIGPNGAGKTMLFRALLKLVPYRGEMIWAPNIKIGYVPQKLALHHDSPLTTREFFLLQSRNFWLPTREILKHLEHELELVGLPQTILEQPIAELSGGQLQRALIAWAMLNHPDILLFDEPTTGIDIGAEETIYNLIHKLQDERGITVLLISHDLNIIYRYANQVLCLNKEVKCQGSPIDVLKPEELSKLYGEGAFYHHSDKKS